MSEGYVFGQAWEQEHARLSAVQDYWDTRSRTHLAELGVAPGWSCLDVGAGAGSLAAWLAAEVMPGGSVLAVDLDARFLKELDEPGLEVRELDLFSEELPSDAFDLVHCRLVLEHLPARDEALGRLAITLRPGGWLVVTGQAGWDLWRTEPDDPMFRKARDALRASVEASGWDTEYTPTVPTRMIDLGLEEVSAEAWRRCEPGGKRGWPHVGWWAFERLGATLIEEGRIEAQEIEHAQRKLLDPDVMHLGCETWTIRGRRPR